MKQPELGKIITGLRKEKGLTQEELVEKCNISVRTIQRIEAGEVTPRSYTVKTILSALDYNLEKMKEDFSEEEMPAHTISQNGMKLLSLAFYMGIIYFVVGFVEFYIDADLGFMHTTTASSELYVGIKAISFITMLFFYTGFAISGAVFKNYLLQVSSVLIIVVFGVSYIHDVFCWFSPSESEEYFTIIFSIVIGCAFVLNGIGVYRLKKHINMNLSVITAIFLIFIGSTLITVLLFIIGFLALIPASILQLILIYRIRQLLGRT